jgi:uncharacterized membrane protein
MTLSRSIIGALVGIGVALVWSVLGAMSLLLVAILGAAGFGIGWILEHPKGLIELLRRLER